MAPTPFLFTFKLPRQADLLHNALQDPREQLQRCWLNVMVAGSTQSKVDTGGSRKGREVWQRPNLSFFFSLSEVCWSLKAWQEEPDCFCEEKRGQTSSAGLRFEPSRSHQQMGASGYDITS